MNERRREPAVLEGISPSPMVLSPFFIFKLLMMEQWAYGGRVNRQNMFLCYYMKSLFEDTYHFTAKATIQE